MDLGNFECKNALGFAKFRMIQRQFLPFISYRVHVYCSSRTLKNKSVWNPFECVFLIYALDEIRVIVTRLFVVFLKTAGIQWTENARHHNTRPNTCNISYIQGVTCYRL